MKKVHLHVSSSPIHLFRTLMVQPKWSTKGPPVLCPQGPIPGGQGVLERAGDSLGAGVGPSAHRKQKAWPAAVSGPTAASDRQAGRAECGLWFLFLFWSGLVLLLWPAQGQGRGSTHGWD